MFDIFGGGKDPQKALQRAHVYVKEGKIESAMKTLESNLTDDVESFEAYMELAKLCFDVEQRGRVVELLHHAQSIVPSRTDEIIALISGLFYRHATIDLGDFLLQLYIEKEEYDQITKVFKELSERDITLLSTRFDKLKQSIENKNIISKKDVENILILTSLRFFLNESEKALEAIETMVTIEIYAPQLLSWVRTIARERYNDPHLALLLLRIQLVNQEFDGALTQAQRIFDKFPDFIDPLITLIDSVEPPKDFEINFTEFLTALYIKKGDFDISIKRLQQFREKQPKKIDDVIKGLRELERIDPKNTKVLYTLGDTYIDANKISLAINEFDKILEIDPNQYEGVLQRYKKSFEKEPNNPLVIQGMVNVYLKQDNVDAAVDVIETAYKSDRGLLDEYIINLNLILENNLNNPKALYFLGLCYAYKDDKENALVIFDSLIENKEFDYVSKATKEICEAKPNDLQYLNLRARTLAMSGQEDETLSIITTYLAQKPEEMIKLLPTFDTIINKRPDLFEKIIPFYKQFKKLEPFVAELAMARAYAFTGKYEESISSFEKCFADEKQKDTTKRALIEVIKEKPEAVPLLLTAARIFLKEGEVEIATQFFKTAQKVDPKAFFEIVDEFYDVLKAFPKDRGVRILLIDAFFSRELWSRVIEEAKRAVEVFERAEAQYFNLKLGQALVKSGTLSDAVRPLMLSLGGPEDHSKEVITYLDKILEIDKSNVPAHVARGRALSRARRINEAVDEFLLTARIVPSRAEYVLKELENLSEKAMANTHIMFAMGSVEITLKKYDDAVKHLLQSCDLEPALVKRVIPLLNKLSEVAPSPLLDFSLAKAHRHAGLKSAAVKFYIKAQAQDKAYREPAIFELKKICAEDPNDIESRKGLARIHFDHRNLEDALDIVREIYGLNVKESNWAKKFVSNILRKNTQHLSSYYFLGRILLDKKNQKKAIDIYKKLIEISPTEVAEVINIVEGIEKKDGELTLYLGDLYRNTGDIKKAIKLFDELFSVDASFGEAIIYQIKEILRKNASFGEAYLLASKIFVFQKEYERAIEAIGHAKQLITENEEIILKEGQLYYEMGKAEKAIKLYTELLEKSKDRKAIYRLIKKTRDEYYKEKIDMIKGDDDDNRLERANIYLLMGKISQAEKELHFVPQNNLSIKHHTLLRAKLYLKKNRPIDALEIMKDLPVDKDTAPVYADIYEAMGSYEAAAMVLRQIGVEGAENRIVSYEKLAQERRLAKGRYLIEGRS